MGQVHGRNILCGRSFLEQCIHSLLIQPGFEKVLQFRESLIYIGLELDPQPGALFKRLLTEAVKRLEIHQVDVIDGDEPVGLLHHQGFSDDVGVNLIRFGLADVVLPEG